MPRNPEETGRQSAGFDHIDPTLPVKPRIDNERKGRTPLGSGSGCEYWEGDRKNPGFTAKPNPDLIKQLIDQQSGK